MMSCAMRSPSCSHRNRSPGQRRVLGVVGDEVAQQQRRALHVAPGLLEEVEHLPVGRRRRRAAPSAADRSGDGSPRARVHGSFTATSPVGNRARAAAIASRMEQADWRLRRAQGRRPPPRASSRCGPRDGLATPRAARCALGARVRPARRLRARAARHRPREDLYRDGLGRRLRAGDRSIDVYVHKLRVKLEDAVPGTRLIHTHVGFGYRFDPEPSHPFHTTVTAR